MTLESAGGRGGELHRSYFHRRRNPSSGNHDTNGQNNTKNDRSHPCSPNLIRHDNRESIEEDLKLRLYLMGVVEF